MRFAWAHAAYAAAKSQIPLPRTSTKGEVSRRYDVYREDIARERALFVIDGAGAIFWSHVSPIEVEPGADGVLTPSG